MNPTMALRSDSLLHDTDEPDAVLSPAEMELVCHSPLFGGMSEECRCVLTARMERRHYAKGESVYAEGEVGREMYVVVAGQLDVLKHGRSLGPLHLADFFGEGSFLDMQPRGNAVVCLEDADVLVMPYTALRSLYQVNVRAYALIMMNLARELSRRLRCADEMACRGADPNAS